MKRSITFGVVVACSVALNAAFIGMWLIHAIPRIITPHNTCMVQNEGCRKCPLHEMLELTDSQWTILKPGIEAYRRAADSLRDEIATAREEMVVELAKTPTDTLALTECRERILNGQKKMQELVVSNVLKQKQILTPEQQRRFIKKVRCEMLCTGSSGMTSPGKNCGHDCK